MKKWSELKGFTVMELLVVLIISGILMAVASGIFYNLHVYRSSLEDKGASLNRSQKIAFLLNKDMLHASDVDLQGNKLECLIQGDTVFYHFEEDLIVRRHLLLVDTFLIRHEINKVLKKEGLLLSFELTLTVQENMEEIFAFQKWRGAAEYFKDE